MREITRVYIDPARSTDDPNGTYSAAARRIVTSVCVPDGRGPFPLVVFAHGDSGHPRKVAKLLDAWAGAGYVVAAPAFPLTNDDVSPTAMGDFVNQPADISHVIDGVLDDALPDGVLADIVDGARIGVAGHSLGGATVFGLVGDSCCRDDRVASAIVIDGFRPAYPGGDRLDADLPLLVVHGDADPRVPYDLGRRAYDGWAGPKSFLTLVDAVHSPQVEDPDSPYSDVVIDGTTRFWDATLRGGSSAQDRYTTWSPPSELARIER